MQNPPIIAWPVFWPDKLTAIHHTDVPYINRGRAPKHLQTHTMKKNITNLLVSEHQAPWLGNLRHAFVTSAIALCALHANNTAIAKNTDTNKQTIARTAAPQKRVTKVTHQHSPSEESKAERDRRLYRECKGLPNAGACLGYAHR